jgi:hypothetical protein
MLFGFFGRKLGCRAKLKLKIQLKSSIVLNFIQFLFEKPWFYNEKCLQNFNGRKIVDGHF